MQTVPSREGSEWTPGGGKEGRWRRPSRRATPALEFLRRKDRARRRESLLSSLPRRATSARFRRRRRGIVPSSLSFYLPGLLVSARRECDRFASPASLPPAKLWIPRREEEEEVDEEEEEEAKGKEDARGRRGRNE